MVGRGTSAEFYRLVLDALYDAIEALDTTEYRWLPSDRWRRARYVAEPSETAHLEVAIDLGGFATSRPLVQHEASLTVWCRYAPDDDSRSQARGLAAVRAAEDLLRTWSSHGARTLPLRVEPGRRGADWVEWVIRFSLHYEVM